MKHIMKTSTNSKQHKIDLTPHSTVNPTNTINAFRVEWDLLNETPDRFADLIAANVWEYAKRYDINIFANGYEPCDYVNSVWLDIYDRLFSISGAARLAKSISNKYAKGETETKLFHPMWQSIDAVFKREKRQWERLNGKKKSKDDPNAPHDEATTWQEDADKFVPIEAIADDVNLEERVVVSVVVRQALSKRDRIDQLIAKFTVYGYSNREIGKLIGKSDVTVGKRRDKMKAAFRAAGLHD